MKTQQMISPETPMPVLRVKKVLVPLDFSGPSRNAFKYALAFARQFGSEVVLLHVFEPLTTTAVADENTVPRARLIDAEEKLRALAGSPLRSGNLYITSNVRPGLPALEIVEAAREFDVDLIIMATHGLNGWKHFGLGSTADRVARAASCPVLIVREHEHEFI